MSVTDSDSARMKKKHTVEGFAAVWQWQFQFFVRSVPTGRSMVMTGFAEETVESVLRRMEWETKIRMSELRVIYNGRQLQLEQSLEECGIEKDSMVHLVGHLRSGGYPEAWRAIDYMVSVLAQVCRGEQETLASEGLRTVKLLVTCHFSLPGFAEVFASSKAPSMLAWLYAWPRGGSREHAEDCISHLLSCCRATKNSQSGSVGAVLELCKQLRELKCESNDVLYVSCRDVLSFLLETVGVSYGSGKVKHRVSLRDVFSFVPELVDRLLMSLNCGMKVVVASTKPLFGEVKDFATFVRPLRSRMSMGQCLGFFSSDEKCNVKGDEEDQLLAEEVDYLRVAFVRLLSKMDECLQRMGERLAGKEKRVTGFVVSHSWSEYLNILKELYGISKVFDGAEEMFWRVLMHHRSMLSVLITAFVKRGRGNDHRWILENKSVTNFECRRHLAMELFPSGKEFYDLFHEMLIDRSQLLAQSFEYIGRAKPESLRSGLFIEFKNEEATGPGVLREWFVLVCRAIFNPQNTLFLACPNDCRRFYPNPASRVHPLHLEYFRFSGRIIALALIKKVQVGIVFDRVFFMQLAGNYVTLEDIRDADPYLYRSCKQILEMDADFIDSDALGLTFVREVEVLGCREMVELCPGGRSLVMNSKNREKYVDLLIQNCFVTSISEQVSHFAKGFADILSNSKLQQFFQCLELEDLDWMLYGSEKPISIEDWKAHTKYKGYKESDCQISWFWEIVGRMSAKQMKVLLFFWTSVKYLPVEGFRGLASNLYIHMALEPKNSLPTSHTCFYQLCFPPYSSKAVMQDRLGVITQEHIGCSFGYS